eukprot:c683_g1_i1.p1 GENE.c683_g1_i1~~c683_g1_i1.p1  ORF type:complete len:648 (-),score=104.81 c683_g1_i1:149-2059(-)
MTTRHFVLRVGGAALVVYIFVLCFVFTYHYTLSDSEHTQIISDVASPPALDRTSSRTQTNQKVPPSPQSKPRHPTNPCIEVNGVLHPSSPVCCAAECGNLCGSPRCHAHSLGADHCCGAAILNSAAPYCDASRNKMAPCRLSGKDVPPPLSASPSPLPPRTRPLFGSKSIESILEQAPNSPTMHQCHLTAFTHVCRLSSVTWDTHGLIGHDPETSLKASLPIPGHLSPRLNKIKVKSRPVFPASLSALWSSSAYDETRCDRVIKAPVYVFELYFTSNFFHIINDNLLPLYATIDTVEGPEAIAKSRDRHVVLVDSNFRDLPDALYRDLFKWAPLIQGLTDKPVKYWGNMANGTATVCFRHVTFGLVDTVQLMHPIVHLTPTDRANRHRILEQFRELTYRTFGVPFPAANRCDSSKNSIDVTIVSRRQGGSRHCNNEPELVERAKQMGHPMKIFELDELSFREQLQIWSNTCVFIATHGAGAMNGIFLPPRARVIQVYSFGVRWDYAKSSVDCGAICYRGLYLAESAVSLYGQGTYGEIMIPEQDTTLFEFPPKYKSWLSDPLKLWAEFPKLGVDALIKGKSEFRINPDTFAQVLDDVVHLRGRPLDLTPQLDPKYLTRPETVLADKPINGFQGLFE